jgi:Zn-dependent protease with chaperone function
MQRPIRVLLWAKYQAISLTLMSDSEASTRSRSPLLSANYFDGVSARAHPVLVRIDNGVVEVRYPDKTLALPLEQVRWAERTRYGARSAQLPNGAFLQCNDSQAWDHWYLASGLHDSLVVRMQQHWGSVTVVVLALVVFLSAAYQWGLPALARSVVQFTPYAIDQSIGLRIMQDLDAKMMQPSALSLVQRDNIRAQLRAACARQNVDMLATWSLEFRKSNIGPNAFALPGGTIVMTDEMVQLVQGDSHVLTAVLAHELGHLHLRHGTQMLAQVSALGVITGVLWGDFSWALATVPAWLGQADYSRAAEREADAYALEFMRSAGIDPNAMVTLFEKLQSWRTARDQQAQEKGNTRNLTQWLGIAFASHPADTQRIAFFTAQSSPTSR